MLWMSTEEGTCFSSWSVKTERQSKLIDQINSMHRPLRSPWTLSLEQLGRMHADVPGSSRTVVVRRKAHPHGLSSFSEH